MMESRKVSGSSLPATFSSKEIFMSKSGYEFNYYDERWVISTSDGVNFNWTTSVFETNLQESYKKVLCTRQISQNPYPIRILPS